MCVVFIDFLYHWQTLIAGMLALLAAFCTIRSLSKQIAQQEKFREDDLKRKLRKAKSTLPIALSEATVYSERCYSLLFGLLNCYDENNGLKQNTSHKDHIKNLPLFPGDAMKVIRDCIVSTNEDDAIKLQQIISFAQVHEARFEGYFQDICYAEDNVIMCHTVDALYRHLFDSILLHTSISRLFPYARGEAHTIPDIPNELESGNIINGLLHGIVHEPAKKSLKEYIYKNWESSINSYFSK